MLSLVESEQYASSVKVVLEQQQQQQQQVAEVVAGLGRLQEERQAAIQEICSTFYQDFFGSVDDLAAVRSAVDRIRSQLEDLASEARRAAAEFSARGKAVLDSRALSLHSGQARAVVDRCLRFALLLDELRRLSETGSVCEAVAAIGRARSVFVTPLAHVPLIQHMAAQLPAAEDAVRAQASAKMNEWLSRAWGACSGVGNAAFGSAQTALHWRRALAEQTRIEALAFRGRVTKALLPLDALSSPASRALHASQQQQTHYTMAASMQQTLKSSSGSGESGANALDMTGLLQAVFVFKRQGRLQELREQYSETKRQQVMKLFQQGTAAPATTAQAVTPSTGCGGLLRSLAGFFIIEHAVASIARDLVSTAALEELWRMTMGKCKAVVLNELSTSRTTAAFSSTLDSTAMFAETLHQHRYDVTPVLDFLPESSQRYAEVAFEEFCNDMDAEFRKSAWEPLVIRTQAELEERVIVHGLPVPATGGGMPQKMAFSQKIPEFCRLTKKVVVDFFGVAERLGDVERLVAKTADQCVQRVVRMLGQRPPKDQYRIAAQLLADLHAISRVPQVLEAFIAERCTWGHTPSLEIARRMLEGAQSDSEGALKTMIQARFDIILAPRIAMLASGKADQPASQQPASQEFVEEVKAFVVSVREMLTGVPANVTQSVVTNMLRRVADALVNSLLSDQVKKVPYSALLSLQADLLAFEQFANGLGSTITSSSAGYFTQALQVVRVLLRPDAVQVQDLATKPGAHAVLCDMSLVSALLEKVKEDKNAPPNFAKQVKATLKALSQLKH